MKIYSILFLLFSGCALGVVLRNVRLVDHTSYVINYITKTINVVEQRGWSNLKILDHVQQLNETVMTVTVNGSVHYTNGFVPSIQQVDIQQATVQQIWLHNSTTSVTTVSVTGTLRMHDVAVGYDVIADLEDGVHRYTTLYVHPLITFVFSVIKDVNADTISVTVDGIVPNSSRTPIFRPLDNTTDVLAVVFNPVTASAASILAWGPEVFEPILYDIVTKEIEFPTICYNCAV